MIGSFIAFEGLDGAGKTTQLNLASQWLRSQAFPVLAVADPAGTEYGRILYEAMATQQPCDAAKLLSFGAARAETVSRVVLPAIAARKVVLCDRWIPSTIAYQGFGSGLSVSAIHQVSAIALNGLALPTKTIWLDIPPDESLARSKTRGADLFEREYTLGFLERVSRGYEAQHNANLDDWVRVDATLSETQIAGQIITALKGFLDVDAFLKFA